MTDVTLNENMFEAELNDFTVSIGRKDALKIHSFCKKHGLNEFYFAKSTGAYFGATAGDYKSNNVQSLEVYMEGCDPTKDRDYFENAQKLYGGDDWHEDFELKVLRLFILSNKDRLVFKFEGDSIYTKHE